MTPSNASTFQDRSTRYVPPFVARGRTVVSAPRPLQTGSIKAETGPTLSFSTKGWSTQPTTTKADVPNPINPIDLGSTSQDYKSKSKAMLGKAQQKTMDSKERKENVSQEERITSTTTTTNSFRSSAQQHSSSEAPHQRRPNYSQIQKFAEIMQATNRERESQERQRREAAEKRFAELQAKERQESKKKNVKITKVMKRPSLSESSSSLSQDSPTTNILCDNNKANMDTVSSRSSPELKSGPLTTKAETSSTKTYNGKDASTDKTTETGPRPDIKDVPRPMAQPSVKVVELTEEEKEKRRRDLAKEQQQLILQQVQAKRAETRPQKRGSKILAKKSGEPRNQSSLSTERDEVRKKRVDHQRKRAPRTTGVLYCRQSNGFLLRINRHGEAEPPKPKRLSSDSLMGSSVSEADLESE